MGWVFHRHVCKYGYLWRSIFSAFGYESWYKLELFRIVTIDWNLSSSHAHWQRQGIYVKSYIGAEATHTWLCIMGWVFHRPACKYGHLWRSIFLGFGYESWYKWKLFEIVTIDWNLSSSHAHWQRQGIHVRSYIGKEATYTWLHNGVGFSKAHLQIWLSLVVNFLGLLVWELVQMGAIWIILEL